MKKQAFNPFLPSYEYIPDGEPYVFDGRVYLYGSHDRFNGSQFCLNDYVCWSAPADDLGNWRNEGVIYRRLQDPLMQGDDQYLYAPDMQKGIDGRYYLYYALSKTPVISVAVCDKPAGDFIFYDHIKYPDGCIFGQQEGDVHNFDPGVLIDDDGRVYLYTGFAPTGELKTKMKEKSCLLDGAYCVELEQDMCTIKGQPVMVAPGTEKASGTDFEGHAFFEASSMRKIGRRYYFMYSSILGHELCYAIGDRPDGGFRYGGTIVSNGDIGLQNQAVNYTGNNHGSIVEIESRWYVFYHRQTNAHHFSRQACAEPVRIMEDGHVPQVEITSSGLQGKPLSGTGTYEARIACQLSGKDGTYHYGMEINEPLKKVHPYFTQSGGDRERDGDQYIANLQDGSWAGFKYFDFHGEQGIVVHVRGTAEGILKVSTVRGSVPAAEIRIRPSEDWTAFTSDFHPEGGKQALYMEFRGTGVLEFASFKLLKNKPHEHAEIAEICQNTATDNG